MRKLLSRRAARMLKIFFDSLGQINVMRALWHVGLPWGIAFLFAFSKTFEHLSTADSYQSGLRLIYAYSLGGGLVSGLWGLFAFYEVVRAITEVSPSFEKELDS